MTILAVTYHETLFISATIYHNTQLCKLGVFILMAEWNSEYRNPSFSTSREYVYLQFRLL